MLSIIVVAALESATIGGVPASSCGCNGPVPAAPVVSGEVYFSDTPDSGIRSFFHRLFHRHHEEFVHEETAVIVPPTSQPVKPVPTVEPLPLPKEGKIAPEK